MKKIISTILCFFMILGLTACGSKAPPIVDENGDWIRYPEEEIQEGYYILKDDGMYYQILNPPVSTDNMGSTYSWFCEPYDAAIVHFSPKDKLMFYSNTQRPETVTLYRMTDYGYTLGIMFKVTNETGDLKHPQIIEFNDVYNGQSQVENAVLAVKTEGATTYITGINNHEFTGNLLVNDSFLKGLTKDTMYQLEMYCGTVRKTVNIKADTHLFLQEATYTTSSYEELKSKTFEIYLPQNLTPGYYYGEGIGMFYYEGTINDIDDDDLENILEEEGEETGTEDSQNEGNASESSPNMSDEDAIRDAMGEGEGQVLNDLSVTDEGANTEENTENMENIDTNTELEEPLDEGTTPEDTGNTEAENTSNIE